MLAYADALMCALHNGKHPLHKTPLPLGGYRDFVSRNKTLPLLAITARTTKRFCEKSSILELLRQRLLVYEKSPRSARTSPVILEN